MEIATSHSILVDTRAAALEACQRLRHRLGQPPDIIFVHWSVLHRGKELRTTLADEFPGCQIHGASSCLGGMTEDGVISREGRGLVLMGLTDPEGAYGVASGQLGDTPHRRAAEIVQGAISNARRPGEMPDLVRISSTPGCEDQVISGIESLLGPEVPIIGGSAADNQVRGEWELITHRQHLLEGLVVTVFYPSTTVAFAFHNGYSPTLAKGRITKGGGRVIEEIDHQPAALVYNEWTGGVISPALADQESVLAATTLYPLGRVVGEIGGVPYFTLAHPDRVTPGQGLSLFADIKVGDEVILMRGTVETLISRAGRVTQAALQAGRLTPEETCGAMIVYCAGCMLTVRDRIDEVAESLNAALGGKPFLGTFTFGEQGCFAGGENRHANLMISAIVFGHPK
ncbi:FIST signal transduction protein [Desulfurivibrio dismutans]|uniref:FIST signal transduction protein n=1 Tax=Desulfurivibrio dismutans TaxID=1398908 RepID=UPI0023DA221A|nr:FIST N-terminal domain-containing protein [Desulfurivibrio alkaliphilus]MDF1615089.1 FIST N-terminal domain-containing protein [Desulfurivibrio alkaliphilus]